MEALKGTDNMANRQDGEIGRAAFEGLNQKYGRDISGRLGLYFAAKHKKWLFPDSMSEPDERYEKKIRYSHS
jgi:hypothetical protein